MEQVVGILGGMGPYATIMFYRQLLAATPAARDWEHLHVLIDSNVKIPSRTRACLFGEPSPAPGMIASIRALAVAGAGFAVVPCNSAHFWYDEVSRATPIPWLNILQVNADALARVGRSAPLVLGGPVVLRNRLYSERLPGAVYPREDEEPAIGTAIETVKLHGQADSPAVAGLRELVAAHRDDIDCVLLACTELAGLETELARPDLPVFDAGAEYARATVIRARSRS